METSDVQQVLIAVLYDRQELMVTCLYIAMDIYAINAGRAVMYGIYTIGFTLVCVSNCVMLIMGS